MAYPKKIFHWIDGKEVRPASNKFFPKVNPATGEVFVLVAKGDRRDVEKVLRSAEKGFEAWSEISVVKRAEILRGAVFLMQARKEELAEIVARESGKSKKSALGEVDAAIECGFFFAGEGRRFFGEVLPTAVPNRSVKMVREPVGIGALITPFNNPAAGVAWKIFPALLCGNAVIVKSHEYTPYVAVWYAKVFKEAGVPAGVISVLQGTGPEIGAPLVADPRIEFVSLTGSAATGQKILKATAPRLAKVSIEAGGKNPFVVCDDADLEKAAAVAVAAAFVDAGQRCAAASRIIVFDKVYEKFKKLFLQKVNALKIGTADTDDYGAIISEKRMKEILNAVRGAQKRRGVLLAGGVRLADDMHKKGFFISPTVFERVSPKDEISLDELFGPVVILYRVRNLEEAIQLANDSKFKLSGAIHTASIHRAEEFVRRCRAGVVRVNGPTHGSEPHMPFGGIGLSGNGWREPGTKALEFYSEWKQVSVDYDSEKI
ncbi:MAG: NAD-dependent aldehyde dehydrogenase [Parcubacteria group bacterium GW2011_GWB1_50_9]|nr:MAG: NAD-dependent aldehyde dehydrogenase [Parcubacteria group bacterium GW2011_GWB1_50_9]KKW24984.1 MAG: NAD-dependent aldehyde dehydrogenase [candidate division Kazan bacterium GW2011_GWC1_52_13]